MAILDILHGELRAVDRQLYLIQIGIYFHRMLHRFTVRNHSPMLPVVHSNVQHRNILAQERLKIIEHIFGTAVIVQQTFIIDMRRSLLAAGRTEINEVPLRGTHYERSLHDSGQIVFEVQLLPLHGEIEYLRFERLQARIGTGTELTDN